MATGSHIGTARFKVRSLEELAGMIATLRARKQQVVHCHGVFDLLHIGHLRHFQQARKLGDVLVVTITPDIYVNKGPHRPAFPEELRAEAVAALEYVDYVAINRWPTAVEAIRMLGPDYYVKGPDYKNAADDLTGGISLEEAAVREVGGQLAITDEITFSSSALINRYLPAFPEPVAKYLKGMADRYGADGVVQHLERARDLRVLVVGDAIIDEYQYCEAIGKSSKEPMLAARLLSAERFAGGILAVANHAADFCRHVGLVTCLGHSNSHEGFIRESLHSRVEPFFLYKKDSPTITKRRFIESYFFTKLLEVYEMTDRPLDQSENADLCALLHEQVPRYDLVIVVDFGHGLLTGEAIDILCRQSRFLAVNAQSNAGNLGYHTISKYPRADYVSLTENELRLETRDRHGDVNQMILSVAQRLGCEFMSVTRGKNGCLCYARNEGFFELPAFAGQVVDRVGAGDAFLSLSALLAAGRAPMEIIGFVGNTAGAQAVATVGNRTPIQRATLYKHIASLLK